MQTKEIQKSEWPEFFNEFSRKHLGTPVGIEIFGADLGAQTEETGLALEGITVEGNDVSGKIIITVGARADDHISHSINRPTQVNLEQTDEGVDLALAIKGMDGSTALLRFQSTALPEVADAVSP